MAAPFYVPTGVPASGAQGSSAAIRAELALIEAAIAAAGVVPLSCYAADVNTAGSFWIPTPGWAGSITALYAVNYGGNNTAATVLTCEIGGAAVTLSGTWQFASSDAAGTQVSVTATAANTFTAGQPLEIVSDGGGASAMPAMLCALIARTS